MSETKRKVVLLDETKRLMPCTPANSPWFGRKWPRKGRCSPELTPCRRTRRAGSGVRCEPLFDGDSVLVSPGEEREMREVEGERYGIAERERAKGELQGRDTKKKEERDRRLVT